ncbi:MAG TPA: DUF971 domain-containing protein [Methylomirabilota bacterium]|jgi:DUF971 family protein|nr:DUF971 domain-containing protein [Methylomirabilota bacterium]
MAVPMPRLVVPIEEDQLLRILWDDDLLSEYPLEYLRGWCPCAACQGHGGERRFVEIKNPQLASISLVGNYALNPRWVDGHETGIYTFEYLRSLSEQLASENAVKG